MSKTIGAIVTNPEGYIETQFKVNNAHLDGRQEAQYEEAVGHSKTFATWLKSYDMPVESFLDAGCRTGYAIEALATHFPAARVVGVDIVPEFIKVADLRGEAVVGDLQALPFEDEEFDWTFSCTAIEHCPDIVMAVMEMQRVSKYGFYIQTDLEDEIAFRKNISHFVHRANPEEWIDEFRHPEWWIAYLKLPRHNRIEMIWIRKQYKGLLRDSTC